MNQISGKIYVGEEVVATVDGHWVRAFISFSRLPFQSPSEMHLSVSFSASWYSVILCSN